MSLEQPLFAPEMEWQWAPWLAKLVHADESNGRCQHLTALEHRIALHAAQAAPADTRPTALSLDALDQPAPLPPFPFMSFPGFPPCPWTSTPWPTCLGRVTA